MKGKQSDSTATNEQLKEERQTFTRSGEKVPGMASAQTATLEEKTVAEHRPPEKQANDKPILDELDEQGKAPSGDPAEPSQARVHDGSRELFGAPTGASRDMATDDQFPHEQSGIDDSTDAERAAVSARSTLRKHLSPQIGAHPWTLPVPGPEVDAHGFDDPVSDKFWKNIWVASAVHNVRPAYFMRLNMTDLSLS